MLEKRFENFLKILFIITIFISVVPFWLSQYLPFLDIPQHLSIVSVLHNYKNPFYSYDKFFFIDYFSTQYLFYYIFCDLLSYIVSIETANKIFLSIYAISLPLSVYFFLSVFCREKWASFFSFPFIYNKLLFMGFLNFVFALSLLFLSIAIFKKEIEKPSIIKKIFLFILSILLLHSHLMVFPLFILAVVLIGCFSRNSFKKILSSIIIFIPVLILFFTWIIKNLVTPCEIWEKGKHGKDIVWEGMNASFNTFFERLISNYPFQIEEWCLFAIIILFSLTLILKRMEKTENFSNDVAPEVISIAVLVLYFILPISYKWQWLINARFAPIFALFLPSWVNRFKEWQKKMVFIPVALISIYLAYVHGIQFRKFDNETKDFKKILEVMEPQKKVMSLIFDTGSWHFNEPVYLHFGQYYQFQKGGVVNFSFSNFPPSPVRFREPGGPPPLPLRFEWTPGHFNYEEHGRYYDYFLLRGGNANMVFKNNLSKVSLIARYGKWSVYKKIENEKEGEI